MKKFLQEFKEFAMRGNVVDMAVGVVIGGAFGAIVTSLVNDIITPLFSWLLGTSNFEGIVVQLNEQATLNIGSFIQAILNFLIIAFAIFSVIKIINRFKSAKEIEEVEEDTSPSEAELLQDILNELKNNKTAN